MGLRHPPHFCALAVPATGAGGLRASVVAGMTARVLRSTASEARHLARFSRSRPGFLVGLGVVALTIFLAAFGPHLSPYGPEETLPGAANLPPSVEHWMGTDISGMDVFSRVIAAPRIDLTIALVSTAAAFVGGVVLGVISGFFAGGRGIWGRLSATIVRGADIFQAFPVFIFALALVGFRGPSIQNVIVALAFLNVPFFLRLTRGAVLHVRERPLPPAPPVTAPGIRARQPEFPKPCRGATAAHRRA